MTQRFTVAFVLFLLTAAFTQAQQVVTVPGPAGSVNFGSDVRVLPNGNYLVFDDGYVPGSTAKGVLHLYNGLTNALISSFKGLNYPVGNTGSGNNGMRIFILPNSAYVVLLPNYINAAGTRIGMAAWCSGTAGINGFVSGSNALLGTAEGDFDGAYPRLLTNGHYLLQFPLWDNGSITDAGASMWGHKNGPLPNSVTPQNALVGSHAFDRVGGKDSMPFIALLPAVPLQNGNAVLYSPGWDNGSVVNAGASTLISGTGGTVGPVTTANSLVGNYTGALFGAEYCALTNGNYVLRLGNWGTGSLLNVGATIWCSGTVPKTGVLSAADAFTGTHPSDQSVTDGYATVIALTNGHYAFRSPGWDNGTAQNVGAITWGNGVTGSAGILDSVNSFIGRSTASPVGYPAGYVSFFQPLTNGNYAVASPDWDSGTKLNVGAVTWLSGTGPSSGTISPANSLTGGTAGDQFGLGGIVALTNGNFVASSYRNWDNPHTGAVDAGAVAWFTGTGPTVGKVDTTNALVGTKTNDQVGVFTVRALANGHYVVASNAWNHPSGTQRVGAVTWCNGFTGTTGSVSVANSLVGGSTDDRIGIGWFSSNLSGIVSLPNGNYIVESNNWKNPQTGALKAAAFTWCSGSGPTNGIVSGANSLVGSVTEDLSIAEGVKVLSDGNYMINFSRWDNATNVDAGALFWGDATRPLKGTLDTANALIGATAFDGLGRFDAHFYGNACISDEPYLNRPYPNPAARVGGTVYARGDRKIKGSVSTCNTFFNTQPLIGDATYDTVYRKMFFRAQQANTLAIMYAPETPLATSSSHSSRWLTGYVQMPFLNNDCELLAAVQPSGSNHMETSMDARQTYTDSTPAFNLFPYVRRHTQLIVGSPFRLGTSNVTLYFSQADFDSYNAACGLAPKLPTGPLDGAGIANLRVTQQRGTSASGLPGSFTNWPGPGPQSGFHNPEDRYIVWDSLFARWDVRFAVTGTGGFFVHTGDNALSSPALPVLSTSPFLHVSPVPVQHILQVETNLPMQSLLQLTDITGRVLWEEVVRNRSFNIDLSAYPAGIYLLRSKTGIVQRVVKL